ncbi:MAG: hypothetical protein QNJ31_09530 [Candidatus Caenarcaniphilales bacterium]|nr:hypothetical protein [Candidatus Caenarcaniphilales bacterium]
MQIYIKGCTKASREQTFRFTLNKGTWRKERVGEIPTSFNKKGEAVSETAHSVIDVAVGLSGFIDAFDPETMSNEELIRSLKAKMALQQFLV